MVQNSISRNWLTVSVLAILIGSAVAGLYSIWGVLFIYWGLTACNSGEAYLIAPIDRGKDPVLFWLLTGMWFVFGALYILADIFPEYAA